MMKKNRIIQYLLILVFMSCCSFFWNYEILSASTTGEISFSVEKFTIGQGYLIDPTQVTITQGQTVADVLVSLLKENGYSPQLGADKGFYLSGILNADSGIYKVPAVISAMGDMTDSQGNGLTHPTGQEINIVYPDLCEFSYMSCSGWMYTVNGEFPSMTMDSYTLKDGDVVRIQFSLYGYGGDLGERYANNPYVDIPDRNPLTKRLALMRKYKDICDSKGYSEAYSSAYAAAINMDINNTRFNGAVNALPSEEDIIAWADEKTAQDVTDRINALGTITLLKESAVNAARKAYDALSTNAKEMISSDILAKLTEAETQIASLKKEEANKKAAESVTGKINALGTITLAKESAVIAARKAYNALNTDAKKMVPSDTLAKLTAAEAKIASLKEEEALKKKYTPGKVVLKKTKPGKKKVALSWKKIGTASGYQVFMSAKKSSGFKKIATIKKAKTVTFTKKKLKPKKTYYFRVCAYRKVGKTTYYGVYSAVKKAKVK